MRCTNNFKLVFDPDIDENLLAMHISYYMKVKIKFQGSQDPAECHEHRWDLKRPQLV